MEFTLPSVETPPLIRTHQNTHTLTKTPKGLATFKLLNFVFPNLKLIRTRAVVVSTGEPGPARVIGRRFVARMSEAAPRSPLYASPQPLREGGGRNSIELFRYVKSLMTAFMFNRFFKWD